MVSYIIYTALVGWMVFSIFYIVKLNKKGLDSINLYLYESIPTVFTTLGVLGTFLGIFSGLLDFQVDNITASIPTLLEGLKTAFLTSIIGISLSLVFGRISEKVLNSTEQKEPAKPTDELAVLVEISEQLKTISKENNENFNLLNKSLIGDNDNSISSQIINLRSQILENQEINQLYNERLDKIQQALGGDNETSLLVQIKKLRIEQKDISKETAQSILQIVNTLNSNNQLIAHKFEEFSDLLAKNNTEALVHVMKTATEQFNVQMSALIEKLVQENFQELNSSVQRMNDWQQENKEMVAKLTQQFIQVAENFETSSQSIQEITDSTNKLTKDNGHLSNLIKELQKVMIDDTKFQEITNQLTNTIDTLSENTDSFDETTNKLNEWVRNQMNFSDSVSKLLVRLEDIDKIKDINEIFWENTKKQLNEGVSMIKTGSEQLSKDLDGINEEFYQRLNDTLQNLDTLIQRIIANYE